jgi:spore maturation protein CgeB
MRLLVVGADSEYAIERFYLKYWKANGSKKAISFFAAQNLFYEYYNLNIINKLKFKLGLSIIYNDINKKLIKEIDFFQPTIIFVFKGMEIFPETLKYAKAKNIKLINYNPDNPFVFSGPGSGNVNITNSIELYDLHFTYNREVKDKIEDKFNIPTHFLPFGFDLGEYSYAEICNAKEVIKLCFLGNPDKFRASLIKKLAISGVKIDVYGHNWHKFISNKNVTCFDIVYGIEFWRTLYKYRIQLNIMRPHNLNSHNMRTFEIPGVGGIQLAPFTEDHDYFFKNGKEIFLYNNIEESLGQIDFLLSLSNEKAKELRKNALNASIKMNYTYKNRAEEVFKVISII